MSPKSRVLGTLSGDDGSAPATAEAMPANNTAMAGVQIMNEQ